MPIDGPESTLNDILRRRAAHEQNRRAYSFLVDGETEVIGITYGELERRARAVAVQLRGVCAPGANVLLIHPPGIGFIVGLFACLFAGVAAVPAYPPGARHARARLRAILGDAEPAAVLVDSRGDDELGPILGAHKPCTLVIDTLDELPVVSTHTMEDVDDDAPALIQYTSGSTTTPKGVVVTHRNLFHNQGVIARSFRHEAGSLIVSWLPVYHDMGLSNVLQAVYAGIPCVLMSPTHFVQRPARWLEAISRYRATTSGGPNFAYELCARRITPEQKDGLDLSAWRVAYNGSEPVRAQTLNRFAEAFAAQGFQSGSFRPCYGLAEATLMVACGGVDRPYAVRSVDGGGQGEVRVVSPAAATSAPDTRELVGCGSSMGCRLAIVGPDGHELRAGGVGEIWISGPSVAAGYWNRPEETVSTFGARLSGEDERPYLRTGDLGFVSEGELFVASRLKDLIIVRGQNHHPHDLELTAESSEPSLPLGCGAAFAVELANEERVAIVQEAPRRRTADVGALADAIRREILEEHAVQVAAVVLIKPGTLPRTTSGKVRRAACREQFLAGRLAVVGEWREASQQDDGEVSGPPATFTSIRASLIEATASRLGVDAGEIDPDEPMGRYHVDSLAAIEFAQRVESTFGVAIPIASFFGDATLSSLAERVLSEAAARPHVAPALPSDAIAERTLARGQRARWLLDQVMPAACGINAVARAARVLGDVDAAALRRSLERLVDRHHALRMTFSSFGSEPVQTVRAWLPPGFVEHDARGWSDALLGDRLDEAARRPIDLENGPLLRVELFRRESGGHVLLFAVHHIAVDFWSLEILVADWGALYEEECGASPVRLLSLAPTCADHGSREEAMLRIDGERLGQYWLSQLTGELPIVSLPGDRPPPSIRTYRGASIPFAWQGFLVRRLDALAAAERVTPYMVVLAALEALLHRYTGEEDIIVGTPTAGRSRPELRDVVGCYVNPVAIRGDLSGDPTFVELLSRIRDSVSGALDHQAYPFDVLVERLRPERRPGRPPLFEVLLVWLEARKPAGRGIIPFALDMAGARIDLGGLALESVPLRSRATLFDLELSVGRVGAELHGALTYDTDLFEAPTAARFVEHLHNLMDSALAAPRQRISQLRLLSETERQRLSTWEEPAGDAARKRLHELFERRAAQSPGAIAIAFEGKGISYGELNAQSNRLAHRLHRAGVSERPVAIALDDGPLQVTAMLAVLKAGSCFVCVEPAHPVARIDRILADADPSHLISSAALVSALEPSVRTSGCQVLLVPDTGAEVVPPRVIALPTPDAGASAPAYIAYTSGSGGEPKGILQSHEAFCQFLQWQIERFEMGPRQRIAQWAAISYDAAYCEIFGALLSGATLCMAGTATRRDPAALVAWVEQEAITLLQVVPSFCRELLEYVVTRPSSHDALGSVDWMLLAGEVLPVDLARAWIARYPARPALFNLYGPSEAVLATCYPVVDVRPDARSIPIGRPIAGRAILLLDAHRERCPTGAIGEIYIRSRHLTIGYHRRPEETSIAYFPALSAADPEDRMYRTGDRGRWLSSGDLEFCGRRDEQVKVRGVRVELGEVESTLRRHDSVEDCAAIACEDGQGGLRVVAYVVVRAPVSNRALREAARAALSPQAVPAAFVRLAALPRTRTGKIDRRALPLPDDAGFGAEPDGVPARSALEALVAGVWCEIIGLETIGVHESFFEIGGHSLTAMKVVNRLRQLCGVELPVASLFEAPTVAGLAERIGASRKGSEPELAQIVRDIQKLSDAEVESRLRSL